jgi:hypothetical protein
MINSRQRRYEMYQHRANGLIGARSAVGRRGMTISVVVHIDRETPQQPIAPTSGRTRNFFGRLSWLPLVVIGLLLGASITWTADQLYAKATEESGPNPVISASSGLDAAGFGNGWRMALTREIALTDVPGTINSCDSLRLWLFDSNAFSTEPSRVLMSFRGTRDDRVTITGIQIIIDSKSTLPIGSQFSCPGSGSPVADVAVGVNLDEIDPTLRDLANGTLSGPYFRTHSINLSSNEMATLVIQAVAFKAAYRWHLEAHIRTSDGEGTVPIPGIYQTAGAVGSYGKSWTWNPYKLPQALEPASA